jgi:hypothetical protein
MLQSIAYFSNNVQKYWTDENYYGYVYLTYDQKENKIYIGHKTKKIEDTLDYFGSGTIIGRIQRKRGAYFLKKIILGVCYTLEELIEQETECKHFFNALNPLYGYNIIEKDTGGDTFTNNPNKEKLREKHRQNALNKKTFKNEKGKFSQEHRDRLSKANKGRISKFKGKTYEEIYGNKAEEQKRKIKDTHNTPEAKKRSSENVKSSYEKRRKENPQSLIDKNEKLSKILKGRPSKNKGKTYEEIYKDRAEEQKRKRGLSNAGKISDKKGKTYGEYYGKDKGEQVAKKISKSNMGRPNKLKGKTYEEKYGKEKAEEIKSKQKKNHISWNKGLTKDQDSRLEKSKECRKKISAKLKGNKNGLKNK